MEYRVNYTVVGIFIVVLTTAMLSLAFWLTTSGNSKDYTSYAIYMKESVYGLSQQAPVKFNGVTIGYVNKIQLNPHNLQEVRLLVNIEKKVPITQSTVATLKSQGITGITYIGLEAQSPRAPLLALRPGETYPIIPSKPSLLVQLSDALSDVTNNLNTISENFQRIFDRANTDALRDSLQNMSTFTKTLAQSSEDVRESVNLAKKLLNNSAKASAELPKTIKRVDDTLATIKRMANNMQDTSKQVNLTMRDSRVAVQSLSQQALPSIIQLIHRLDGVAGNVEQFSAELAQNPSVIIRGKQPHPAGPGE